MFSLARLFVQVVRRFSPVGKGQVAPHVWLLALHFATRSIDSLMCAPPLEMRVSAHHSLQLVTLQK